MLETAKFQPRFDFGFFLKNAEEPGMGETEISECRYLWAQWSHHLFSDVAKTRESDILAVWLGREVEEEIDAAWADSPSHGYLLNALAQTLCMCAARERLPELEAAGCAPVPLPTPELASALSVAGLPARTGTGLVLARRYSVVTPIPFTGLCAACSLRRECPSRTELKKNGTRGQRE